MLMNLLMPMFTLLAAPEVLGAAGSAPGCEHIHLQVTGLIEAGPAIALSAEPKISAGALGAGEGMDCEGFDPLERALAAGKTDEDSRVELGEMGGRRVAASSSGPSGSGRFWQVRVAVQAEAGLHGGCSTSSTVAWRNIHAYHDRFGRWDLLAEGPDGQTRLILWWSVEGHDQAALAAYILIPLAYQLRGDRLIIDGPATRAGLSRFGRHYAAIAALPDNRAAVLHRAAAQALQAVASRTACPATLPPPPAER